MNKTNSRGKKVVLTIDTEEMDNDTKIRQPKYLQISQQYSDDEIRKNRIFDKIRNINKGSQDLFHNQIAESNSNTQRSYGADFLERKKNEEWVIRNGNDTELSENTSELSQLRSRILKKNQSKVKFTIDQKKQKQVSLKKTKDLEIMLDQIRKINDNFNTQTKYVELDQKTKSKSSRLSTEFNKLKRQIEEAKKVITSIKNQKGTSKLKLNQTNNQKSNFSIGLKKQYQCINIKQYRPRAHQSNYNYVSYRIPVYQRHDEYIRVSRPYELKDYRPNQYGKVIYHPIDVKTGYKRHGSSLYLGLKTQRL